MVHSLGPPGGRGSVSSRPALGRVMRIMSGFWPGRTRWCQSAKLSTNWQNGPRWWFSTVFRCSRTCQPDLLFFSFSRGIKMRNCRQIGKTGHDGSARFSGGSARFAVVQNGLPVVQHGLPVVQHGLPVVQHGLPVVQHGLRWFSTVLRWFSTVCRGSAWFGWWCVGPIAPNRNFS